MRLITRYEKIPCTGQGIVKGKAIDGTRTRDLHLGKVAYYQLYYYRISDYLQIGKSPDEQGNHLTSRAIT